MLADLTGRIAPEIHQTVLSLTSDQIDVVAVSNRYSTFEVFLDIVNIVAVWIH